MKKRKQAYYDKYFETNWNDIKNIWKGIKSLIFHITVLSLDNEDAITYSYDVANTFNDYFASITKSTKKHKKFI